MLKLNFFAPTKDNPQITDGHLWKLLEIWKSVAPALGLEVNIRPSLKIREFDKYVFERTKKAHPLITRNRTILEVNNQYLFFDAQDHYSVGAKADSYKEIFKHVIKFQYAQQSGSPNSDYILPFTYFTERNHDLLMKYRVQRQEILKNRNFQYSIIWTGSDLTNKKSGGTSVRRTISKNLIKRCKMAKVGRCADIEEYLNLTSKSLVGVAGSRNGQFSQRDMDLLAIGTPFFCKDFNICTYNPIIPNVHYYSIGGDEIGINQTLSYFIPYFEPDGKIKDFSAAEWNEYINISNAGMNWFDENASAEGSLKLLIRILKEKGIC